MLSGTWHWLHGRRGRRSRQEKRNSSVLMVGVFFSPVGLFRTTTTTNQLTRKLRRALIFRMKSPQVGQPASQHSRCMLLINSKRSRQLSGHEFSPPPGRCATLHVYLSLQVGARVYFLVTFTCCCLVRGRRCRGRRRRGETGT